MRFAVLGPLLVTGDTVADIDRPSHRRLLSILLLAGGRPVGTDQLIDRFWGGDPPATAKAALQTHISALRKRLGAELIRTDACGYVLDLGEAELDLREFAAAGEAARGAHAAGRWQEALEQSECALDLWRGRPLLALQDDEFARPEIVRLEELRLELIGTRCAALLQLGRNEVALPDLERFTVEHPLREQLWELLMTARARVGRTADALQAYHDLQRMLSEVGLEPSPALRRLEGRILREDPAVVGVRADHNLPTYLTTFVGRGPELLELDALLEKRRLVTLTGAGGAGKTRLARELAARVVDRYPDGVRMVELAPLSGADVVPSAVSVAFGLRGGDGSSTDALREALRHRSVLCLLDNCEHLLEAAALVVQAMLDAGPGVRVLATSREPLAVPGEAVFDVPPLATPPEEPSDRHAPEAYDAVTLFTERARLASRNLRLGPEDLASMADICRRLDGLPLAIELAAARMGALSPEVVAQRLAQGLQILSGERRGVTDRHRALEATIAWGYDLLTDAERTLFQRLSVFAGGFALDAAEDVCEGEGIARADVVDLLARLVEKSMVTARQVEAGRLRYRVLRTLQSYAADRLAATSAVERVQARHLAWCCGQAEQAVDHLDQSDQLRWLERLGAERDNLLSALDFASRSGDDEAFATLATALGWYWAKHGQHQRAIAHLSAAVERVDGRQHPDREADLRSRLAGIHYGAGDEGSALRQAEMARDLVRNAAPSPAKVRALSEYASLHLRVVQQEPGAAVSPARDAVAAAVATGDGFAQAHALRTLGTALSYAGATGEGLQRLRAALAIALEIDNPSAVLGVYLRLFMVLLEFAHDDAEAVRVAEEANAWLDGGGDRLAGSAALLLWFVYGFTRAGRYAQAERALERSAGYHLEGMALMSYHAIAGTLRWTQGRLDEAAREAADLRAIGPSARYYRVSYPLEAEIAAGSGRLEDVRRLVEEHLAADVAPVEQALKTGTLLPLVRAEVDAAIAASGPDTREHLRRARRAIMRMRDLIAAFPPSPPAGIRLEMPDVYLLLGEAELSRARRPDPALWRELLKRPDYAYWRAYARWRLAESMLQVGDAERGVRELHAAHRESSQLGARLLVEGIESLAGRMGVDLGDAVSPST